jgi:uncharacterized repeat protein (TIGR02543 family)
MYAAAEANMIKNGASTTIDLSEAHMAYATSQEHVPLDYGFVRHIDGGGHRSMAAAYLMRGKLQGAVTEESDKFPSGLLEKRDLTITEGKTPSYTVKDIIYLSDNDAKPSADVIKRAILNYGAVGCSMLWDGSAAVSGGSSAAYFNSTNNAYYYNGGAAGTNHGITLVGWDDNFPSTNFNSAHQPSRNGAWLVKNSWGTSWGDGGYFWISYEDSNTTLSAYVVDTVVDYTEQTVYEHDPHGVGAFNSYDSHIAFAANVFTVSSANEHLGSVKTFIEGANYTVDVYVVPNYTNATSLNVTTATRVVSERTFTNPGWYTLDFTPVTITGPNFAVIIKYSVPSGNAWLPLEISNGFTSTASAGESFISYSGIGSWEDIGVSSAANVNIKAVTTTASVPTYSIILSESGTFAFQDLAAGYTAVDAQTVTIRNSGNMPVTGLQARLQDATNFEISTLGKNNLSSVSDTTTFTVQPKAGLSVGQYTDTVIVTGNNGASARFEVKVTVRASLGTTMLEFILHVNNVHDFGTVTLADYIVEPLEVMIENIGDLQITGLNVVLSGRDPNSFIVTQPGKTTLNGGYSTTFTVIPKNGLAVNAQGYTATVTVAGTSTAGNISKSFDVDFMVTATPAYGITLSQTGPYIFPNATEGYGALTPLSVTVRNVGNQPAEGLTVQLTGTDNDKFEIITGLGSTSLIATGTTTFTVAPKSGLDPGTYIATVEVAGTNITPKTFTVSFTVDPKPSYAVTVINGTGSGTYEVGETVTVTADPPLAEMRFKNWTATGLTLTQAQSTSDPLSFTMPNNAVTLEAVYEEEPVTVTSLEIIPPTVTLNDGIRYGFSPELTGSGKPSQDVTWSVSGFDGAVIDEYGVLDIPAGIPDGTVLTITAIYGSGATQQTATATVTIGAPVSSSVTGVTVTPDEKVLSPGDTFTFSAKVSGTGNPSQEVTWDVTGGSDSQITTSGGALTVGLSETASTLTVTATSVEDASQFGTAIVTIRSAYTVTFDASGGAFDDGATTRTVKVTPPVKYAALPAPNPTRSGYTFTGWNTAAGGSFTANTPVTADITVYAQWRQQSGPSTPTEPEEPTPTVTPVPPTPTPTPPSGSSSGSGSSSSSSSGSSSSTPAPTPTPIDPMAPSATTSFAISRAISSGAKTIEFVIPPGRIGAYFTGDSLLKIKKTGKPLDIKSSFFTLSIPTRVLDGWNVNENSAISIKLTPVSNNPDNLMASRLLNLSTVNSSLLKKIYTLEIRIDDNLVPRSVWPIMLAINTKDFTAEQLASLTGVYYTGGISAYRQLGGELSPDGKTFYFWAYESGIYGIILSDNISKLLFTIGSRDYTRNGSTLTNEAAPYISADGRTMVPLRAISESLGADVAWNDATRTMQISRNGSLLIRLTLGQQLPGGMGALEVQNDRSFVPVRYVAETLEANVVWNETAKSVSIYQ